MSNLPGDLARELLGRFESASQDSHEARHPGGEFTYPDCDAQTCANDREIIARCMAALEADEPESATPQKMLDANRQLLAENRQLLDRVRVAEAEPPALVGPAPTPRHGSSYYSHEATKRRSDNAAHLISRAVMLGMKTNSDVLPLDALDVAAGLEDADFVEALGAHIDAGHLIPSDEAESRTLILWRDKPLRAVRLNV